MNEYNWTRLMSKLREIEGAVDWGRWILAGILIYVILGLVIMYVGFASLEAELHEIAELLGHEHG